MYVLIAGGGKVGSNGTLVEILARYAREAGRAVASPAEARKLMRLEAALRSRLYLPVGVRCLVRAQRL